jgi:hypothetical protein
MTLYKTNIQLKNAVRQDYERLDAEMENELFNKLQCSEVSIRRLAEQGREYHYQGEGSLQEITAGAYRAAHNTGKDYSFTITQQKRGRRF